MKTEFVSDKNFNYIIDCYNKNIELGRYGFSDAIQYISEFVHHAEQVTDKQRYLVIEMLNIRLTNDMKSFISIAANNTRHMWAGGLTLKELSES